MPTSLTRCIACGLLALVASVHAGAAEDPVPATRIDALIRQLGDTSFETREAAGAALVKLGEPARKALRASQDNDDPEIRYRARQLSELIQKNSHLKLVDRFLQNPTDSALAAMLPGWERFREGVGSGKSDRLLFAQMQKAEPELMRLSEQESQAAAETIARRMRRLQLSLRNSSAGVIDAANVSAAVFAGAHPRGDLPKDVATIVYSIASHTKFSAALKSNPEGAERRLAGLWLKADSGSNIDYQKTRFAMQYNLREGVVPAARVLKSGAGGHMLHYALLACGQLGSAEQLPQLESFFAKTTLISRAPKTGTYRVQVRDIALLCAIHATKQNYKSYGYTKVTRNKSTLFSTNSCGFETDVARDSAFQLWEFWKASRLKSPAKGGARWQTATAKRVAGVAAPSHGPQSSDTEYNVIVRISFTSPASPETASMK